MTPRALKKLDDALGAFLDEMVTGMGRPERRSAMRHYVTGLLLDGERKSMQPMAARLVEDPKEVEAMRQRLQECIVVSPWSDAELLRRLGMKLDRELPGLEAWVVDDTGQAKKGKHSVGVARQYSGTLGRTDNCQVLTSLHVAGPHGSCPIGWRLYLPQVWTDDRKRCKQAGVPDDVEFQTKWKLALGLIDQALGWGLSKRPVLADAGYGEIPDYRTGLTERGLPYVVGIPGNHLVWKPGTDPHPPKRKPGRRGRPSRRWEGSRGHKPVQLAKLVKGVPREKYKKVTWREGSRGKRSSRFLAFRVRPAPGHSRGKAPEPEQWLLAEWPSTEKAPKFHLSTLPADTNLRALVRMAKLRWRVERDYQEMKGELGLDHFEGRSWRGLHHHLTLCTVAHGFLTLRRVHFPPIPDAVDVTDGATAAPTGSAPPHRLVPPLRPSRPRPLTTPSTVAAVSGSPA